MRVDIQLSSSGTDLAAEAHLAEASGYDGVMIGETSHDPFVALALPAAATSKIDLGIGVAVAFARTPMTVAVAANDLQLLSRGRLRLGLGSQVKAHVSRRFSMPWSHPAPRMKEFILAVQAIWACWNQCEPLNFAGQFYTHTLMPPFFNPGPNPYGHPAIALAAVGERMTEVAGEVADMLLCHGFTTERYIREVTRPALLRGSQISAAPRAVEIGVAPFVVTGLDERQLRAAADAVRQQLAFYASTPAYRPVLELHGWGHIQPELAAMTRAGQWAELGAVINDEMLGEFAVVGEPDQIGPMLAQRFGELADRIAVHVPEDGTAAMAPAISYLIATSEGERLR